MTVVPDANNVLISAVAGRGLCEAVLECCLEEHDVHQPYDDDSTHPGDCFVRQDYRIYKIGINGRPPVNLVIMSELER